jgi:hypothetical protein
MVSETRTFAVDVAALFASNLPFYRTAWGRIGLARLRWPIIIAAGQEALGRSY